MVVGLAIGQALALVVAVAQEGFLALGADEVLDVPVLAWKANKPMKRCAGQSQERLKQLDQLGGGSANQIQHPSGLNKLCPFCLSVLSCYPEANKLLDSPSCLTDLSTLATRHLRCSNLLPNKG